MDVNERIVKEQIYDSMERYDMSKKAFLEATN